MTLQFDWALARRGERITGLPGSRYLRAIDRFQQGLIVGELGLGVLAAFCLVSLVWMVFNSWALLFAIADAEIAQ